MYIAEFVNRISELTTSMNDFSNVLVEGSIVLLVSSFFFFLFFRAFAERNSYGKDQESDIRKTPIAFTS